jgi:hypothetical protein
VQTSPEQTSAVLATAVRPCGVETSVVETYRAQ